MTKHSGKPIKKNGNFKRRISDFQKQNYPLFESRGLWDVTVTERLPTAHAHFKRSKLQERSNMSEKALLERQGVRCEEALYIHGLFRVIHKHQAPKFEY